MATHFDLLNRDILNSLKPYLGKELDHAIIEGMTPSWEYSFLTWFARAMSIGVSLTVMDITRACLREKELVGAFLSLMIGVPCAISISSYAEYFEDERKRINILNQERRLRLTLELLEKAKVSA